MGEWDEGQETDPDVFAEPTPARTDEVTKRRCGARCPVCDRACGQELPPCDCASAAKEVGRKILESMMGFLLAHGSDPAGAARIVQEVARDSGWTLL